MHSCLYLQWNNSFYCIVLADRIMCVGWREDLLTGQLNFLATAVCEVLASETKKRKL